MSTQEKIVIITSPEVENILIQEAVSHQREHDIIQTIRALIFLDKSESEIKNSLNSWFRIDSNKQLNNLISSAKENNEGKYRSIPPYLVSPQWFESTCNVKAIKSGTHFTDFESMNSYKKYVKRIVIERMREQFRSDLEIAVSIFLSVGQSDDTIRSVLVEYFAEDSFDAMNRAIFYAKVHVRVRKFSEYLNGIIGAKATKEYMESHDVYGIIDCYEVLTMTDAKLKKYIDDCSKSEL